MADRTTPREPTVLIIGAGTFGVSTAYHLAQTYHDPTRITIIDRTFPSPLSLSSTSSTSSPAAHAAAIDINRIIRADYPSSLYCNLANEAMHAWYWSNELGPCYHKVGWLMLDEQGSDLQPRIFDTLRARGTHLMQEVALEEIASGGGGGGGGGKGEKEGHGRSSWGPTEGTDTRAFASAYFNPDAGWVDAAQATTRFLATAAQRGVRKVVGDVAELVVEASTGHVRGAKTRDGKLWTADHIVLAAGAWTSALLSPVEDALGVPEADRIERQAQATACVAAYYRVADEDVARMTRVGSEMPCVVYGRAGEVIPAWTGVGLLKYNNSATKIVNTVTTASGRRISVPPPSLVGMKSGEGDGIPAGLKRETEALLTSKLMPRFARDQHPEHWRVCWDARTPTEDLLLCEHPSARGLYIITGGSFCGYKFLPNIGKYMLNVLNGQGNGPEKDRAWGWKTDAELAAAAAAGTDVIRELNDFDVSGKSSRL